MAAQTDRGIPISAVSPRFLHTNSTSHTGPFSAIAELIDNAYDPDVSATQFWIDKTAVKGQDCLTFTDNGNGMDYDKMHKMLSFGFSDKQTINGHVPVGLYGNGFKSGSMRLGKDAIVFSKKDNIIMSSNELEFDITKDRYDIRIPVDNSESSSDLNGKPEYGPECKYSLRAYSSILYLKPRMQIIIRGQKVKTQLVSKSLANIAKDSYKPAFLCKKAIKIIFGYNTKSQEHYGLMMYHKNRLIKAYERVACQCKGNSTGVGVIGVIECNYLSPMHNKQDFDNTEEYRKTIQNVSIKLEEYWKEMRFRKNKNSSVPVEDSVKRPDQNWVQCDDCLKWRKLPDGIDNAMLPEKWQCNLNPDPQFRSCLVEEEPEDSDDEEPRYQKTYKQHERRLQMEKSRQQKEQEEKGAGKELILALAKENAKLKEDLVRQSNSPARGTPDSHLHRHAGSRSPDVPVITHVRSLATTSTGKRSLGSIQENGEIKRARTRDIFESNTPGSPSTSTASPEVRSAPVIFRPEFGGDPSPTEDDDIMFVKVLNAPKSATETFDITKVKSECVESKEELGKQMEHANSDSAASMETSAAALPSNSSIGTQTHQNPVVKQEEVNLETGQDGESNSINFDPPTVETSTSTELNAETRPHQKNVPILEEEIQEKSKTTSTLKSEEELSHGDISDESSPGYQSSAKLENSVLDVLEAQQQQDTLLELLEVAAKERDESRSQQLLLSSQVEELRSQLQELKQSTLKNEQSHHSTQTNPEKAEDYKVLYLQAKEQIKQLQDELSKLTVEKAMWERNGQEASLECDDELACQIDSLLRQLDQRNKDQEELKEKVDSLENEKYNLLTCGESLRKELEEIKSEIEKVKLSVEDREVQTDFPSSHEESTATSAEALNSGGGSDSPSQQHETQDRSENVQENNNSPTDKSKLRELRQKVAQLLLTFIPALDLQQVNYDCDVIDEILTQVSPQYLFLNSTSHPWPFSAIAELIDNAYDPDVSAKQFWIDQTVFKEQDCLIFMDNGKGMDYDKMQKMLSFGLSDKQTIKDPVGNGFKSGSMRLGKDAIVFSKKASTITPLGELEFDLKKHPNDIRIPVDVYKSSREKFRRQAWGGMSVPESEYSLRAYCSILYLKPRMQIILKGLKVETQYVTKTLAKVITDTYQPVCLLPIKKAITITFGYKTKSKEHYGLMMYHENRLIKAYERVACQRRDNNRKEGIIGVIVCNHLTPIHNKQDFEDNEEYRRTISSVEKKLEDYWMHVHFIHDTKCTGRFEDCVKQPDQQWVQCDDCLKWRKLPDSIVSETLPIKWLCHMNTDPKYRSCTDEEEPEVSNDGQTRKPPYQNWVQCDDCQKWRKLPDGIDTAKLPEKWQCSLNPDPQFRGCLVDEEPYNSDDEEPRYQKTYKQ
ncbi:MORC family CW-type zinc finger protein 3-like, partial [Clarias magur]